MARPLAWLATTLALLLTAAPALGGTVLDRVRAEHTLRCGAAARPAFAAAGADGVISGSAVDLCRAVGIAVLGRAGRIEFQLYESARAFDAVRRGADELFFLDGAEITAQHLLPFVLPGPTVYFDRTPLAVRPVIAATSLEDGRWAALVAWVLNAELLSGAPDPPVLRALGLRPGWRDEVDAAVGRYAEMLQRHLTPLHLQPGPNALWPEGLLFPLSVP